MLTKQKYEEEILRIVQSLPESELPKVVSILERIGEDEKRKKKDEYRKAVKELSGKYKDVLSSTEEFMRRKQEEKELDL